MPLEGSLIWANCISFEQARELSIDLLEKWLSQFKFKDWANHSSTGAEVTIDEKRPW